MVAEARATRFLISGLLVALLVGCSATTPKEERVDQVKLAGEVWSARSYDPSIVIEAGQSVNVLQIEGATALVYPSEEPWTTSA